MDNVLAGLVACCLNGLDNDLAGFVVALEVGSEPALVADAGGIALLVQNALQGVERLGDVSERLRRSSGADGHCHELLEVHAVVGVLAAVEMFIWGTGSSHSPGSAQICVERQFSSHRRRAGNRHRDAQDRVGPELALHGRPVQVDH